MTKANIDSTLNAISEKLWRAQALLECLRSDAVHSQAHSHAGRTVLVAEVTLELLAAALDDIGAPALARAA